MSTVQRLVETSAAVGGDDATARVAVSQLENPQLRPLGAGDQEQASNHCELLPLRAVVVS